MKFNVEIDLDWIGEDSSIDDEVKNQIISTVEGKVLKSLEAQVKQSMEENIEAKVAAMINQGVAEKVNELMSMSRTATDGYGRVVKADFTLESLLIDAIDGALVKKTLGENGRPVGTYDKAIYTQFEYMATKDIPALIDKKVKELGEGIQKDIHNLVSEKIKTQVADKLTALIVDNSTALSLRQ